MGNRDLASPLPIVASLINGQQNGQGMHGKHRASIRYEDEYRNDGGELQFVATGTRPSRSPTPEVVTPRDSGCSCFGWFSKKKKEQSCRARPTGTAIASGKSLER